MDRMEQIAALCQEFLSKTMEHGDSVRVFVTLHDGGENETKTFTIGAGNFYAQLGQTTEWLQMQEQYQRNAATREGD